MSGAGFASVLEKKRAGAEHSREEIEALVRGYCAGDIDDERFASWLRAVMAKGMSLEEITALTQAMASSGTTIDWSDVSGTVVDKHSTGGVGDAVSLIAVPLAAARGVKVAKLAGRALGHTGGTLNKLECIPGLQTQLSVTAFKRQVATVGCAIAGASESLAPADKKIYALRHRTNTIDSIPLLAASVLSKKIAGGAPHLVIDVKAGRCAFMQTVREARELAQTMVRVAQRLGRSSSVLITDMESPLARSVGDALELDEALRVLQGRDDGRLCEVALAVAEAMLAMGQEDNRGLESRRTAALRDALRDGSAFQRFVAMARAQGGDIRAFDRRFEPSLTIAADASGFVASIDGRTIGEAVAAAKDQSGRVKRESSNGPSGPSEGAAVGIRMLKREGAKVGKGEALMEVFGGAAAAQLAERVRATVHIAAEPPTPRPAVIERLHAKAN